MGYLVYLGPGSLAAELISSEFDYAMLRRILWSWLLSRLTTHRIGRLIVCLHYCLSSEALERDARRLWKCSRRCVPHWMRRSYGALFNLTVYELSQVCFVA